MARIEITTPDGEVLEGRRRDPDGQAAGVAVLGHPHPLYGGSMDSWMMPVLERAVVAAGWHALRFNQRGVGSSTGSFAGSDRAVADVAAAVDWMLGEIGASPVLLGGWSFGATVTLCHGIEDDRVRGWFGVGTVLDAGTADVPTVDRERMRGWSAAKLFVHGTGDEFTSPEAIEELAEGAVDPVQVHLIDGGDHFLATHGDALAREVGQFARSVAEEA